MEILKQNELEKAAKILRNGGVIAFPTETVFGLGVVFDDENAYKKLIQVKRRPPEKPFTVMLADPEDIKDIAYVDKRAKKLIKSFMPGQFTIILKAKESLPTYCVSADGNVGIRISSDEVVRDLIRKTGKPLLVPSANKSGEAPLTNSDDVVSVFKDEIDGVIIGESISNIPSTIVIIDKEVKIIREGIIKKIDIEKVLGEQL